MRIVTEILASALVAAGVILAARELIRLRRKELRGWHLIMQPAARQLRHSLSAAALGALVLLINEWNNATVNWTVFGIVAACWIAELAFWLRRRAPRRA
jgi:hypothetical protein